MRVLVLCCVVVWIQAGICPAGAARGRPAEPAYRVQCGDTLDVQLWHEGDQARSLAVDANGYIPCPVVGIVRVEGLTLGQVTRRITDGLKRKHIRDPLVTVTLRAIGSTRTINVTVMGQVNQPGQVRLAAGSHLADAVAAAGGPSPKAALRKATLARRGRRVVVDLDAAVRRGQRQADWALKDGDLLVIPEAYCRLTVLGEFARPGSYAFHEGDTVADVMSLGGGTTPDADLEAAVLMRGGQQISVDLRRILDGTLRQCVYVEDGDTLVVPSGIRVLVYGAVRTPGAVSVKRGMKVVDVLAAAGGMSERARMEKATVVRMVDGRSKVSRLNLRDIVRKGGPGNDFIFVKGDVLYVPEKGKSFDWGIAVSALWLITTVVRK